MKNNCPHASRGIYRSTFGTLEDGREVALYTLVNANGLRLTITPYGGIVVSLEVPDAKGSLGDIVLGFDSLSDYLSPSYRRANPYFGALIGRYGNRIASGVFSLDDCEHALTINDGRHHLHGGVKGFDQQLWDSEPFENTTGVGLKLSFTSQDGDQGYPGELIVNVNYTLSDDNALIIDYRAISTASTPVNLTQHSYFNLEGDGKGDILDHRLKIAAGAFTPVDDELIPTGEIRSVAGSPFDFREMASIGSRIEANDEQLARANGYDHNFVLDRRGVAPGVPTLAARLIAPNSGRVMEILTTEPGLQFYSGNFLDGSLCGKNGQAYGHRAGLALETQHFPDSPNKPAFPSTFLSPGEVYATQTRYIFSTTSDS